MYKEEIENIKQALQASPENEYLQKMLLDKMEPYPEYDTDREQLLQDLLRQAPNNYSLKGKLIRLYFRQEKYSTCIVIAEDLDISTLNLKARGDVAKSYLRQGAVGKAQEIYQLMISEDPNYKDDELDAEFRIQSTQKSDFEQEEDEKLLSKPDVKFVDVGGMSNVKREIDLKIIKPLANADLYASYGKKIGGGILLYGPPGCGKTFIAKATAGEIDANFINITLNDILDMWIGQSEKNLNRYFELARRKKPCVIFIDEIDALGAKRSDMKQSAGRNVINQFLAELDGIESNNDGILIIGATNSPWHLDSAFLRPGRFDRIIFVPPPDKESKEEILKLKLKEKPKGKIDYKKVAGSARDFSGADLNAVIDIAIEKIIEEAIASGTPKPIETADLTAAIKKHNPSTTSWFATAKNYALFANQSGLYDDILKYLK